MLELDGSFGEGGGQILRTSLALSLLTGQAFHLRNVRARRSKPGLRPQHLMSVRAAAAISQAQVRGASLGSSDLVFDPGQVQPGKYHFAIGTAGATSLVLHTVYLPLAWRATGPSEVIFSGGTHVNKSPCFHFLESTWGPYMELLDLRIGLRMRRPGFYPRGGGVVEAHIGPCARLNGLCLPTCGQVTRAAVMSAVAGLPHQIAERQARQAMNRLRQRRIPTDVQLETWDDGPGTVLTITLDTTPVPTLFCGLGARGKPAERVADEALDETFAYLDTVTFAVDAHSADQLVLPLAVAEGPSMFRVAQITPHLLTNLAVIRQFVDRDIACEGSEGEAGTVRIDLP
jgi:RNA 3'-terminal phosphate cyclase (ATP)